MRLKDLLEFINITPPVSNSIWDLSHINPCIRINSYTAPSVGFTHHYDARFCESEDVRSILSVVIYLNSKDFQGGNTIFYDKKDKLEIPGLTIKEEIEMSSGIQTYEKVIISNVGECVIFKHDILHSGLPLVEGTKYIIRADVVYKRVSVPDLPTIFHDVRYQKSANYFRGARIQELKNNTNTSGELYERNISISKSKYEPNTDIWIYISSFLNSDNIFLGICSKKFRGIIHSSKSVFWNDLYHKSNRSIEIINYNPKSRYNNICNTTWENKQYVNSIPRFIPLHTDRSGIINNFKYNSYFILYFVRIKMDLFV